MSQKIAANVCSQSPRCPIGLFTYERAGPFPQSSAKYLHIWQTLLCLNLGIAAEERNFRVSARNWDVVFEVCVPEFGSGTPCAMRRRPARGIAQEKVRQKEPQILGFSLIAVVSAWIPSQL